MINRVVDHFRRWNIWRKHSLNKPLHKLLVLFGVIKSPTMIYVLLPEEEYACPPGKEFTRTSCGKNPECNNCWLDWLRQEAE